MTKTKAKMLRRRELDRLDAIADRVLAAGKRVAAKRAPSRAEARAEKEARARSTALLRLEVFGRANLRCECCGSKSPAELHHLVSGPDRRARESVETCAAVCVWCHVDLHKGRVESLLRMLSWANDYGFAEAHAAICRRLDKINEARK